MPGRPTHRQNPTRQPAGVLPPLPEPVRFDLDNHAVDAAEEREQLLTLIYIQRTPDKLPATALPHALRSLGSATALLRLSATELADRLGCPAEATERFVARGEDPKLRTEVRGECKRLDHGPNRLVSLLDSEYPPMLRFAPAPPLAIWIRGQLMTRDAAAVAVLGASRVSTAGQTLTQYHAEHFAEHGFAVVNGGEAGVDATAIDAAIRAGGRAVIALGAGLTAHGRPALQAVYDRVTDPNDPHGVMLSTVPLLTPPDAVNQVAGDHLVTHLALACLVVRSRRNGGAMIAARLADDAGRPVLTVPGEPDADDVQGCHQLLRSGRAALALHPDDALEAAGQTVRQITERHAQQRWLQPHFTAEHPLGPAERSDRTLISCLRRAGLPLGLPQLAGDAELEPAEAAYRLSRLRLLGLVAYESVSQRYALNHG
ncbi:MAG: DNA-processing protein DprA [Planctomycetota bacterium]